MCYLLSVIAYAIYNIITVGYMIYVYSEILSCSLLYLASDINHFWKTVKMSRNCHNSHRSNM